MTASTPTTLECPASKPLPTKGSSTLVLKMHNVAGGGSRRLPVCQMLLYFLLGFGTACVLISVALTMQHQPLEWAASAHTPATAVDDGGVVPPPSISAPLISLRLRDHPPAIKLLISPRRTLHVEEGDERLVLPPRPTMRFLAPTRTPTPAQPTTPGACETSNVTVNGVPVGDVMSYLNTTAIAHCQGRVRSSYFRCAGFLPFQDHSHRWEDRLVRSHDPILFPMHGGVTAMRMMKLMLQLAAYCPLPLHEVERWPNGTVIVELGSGNAAGLSVLAPPRAGVYGVGTDIAHALIDHGKAFFPHLHLHRAIGAPMVPTGAATCVYSIGVVLLLTGEPMCNHLSEGLRLLQPGGKLIT